MVKRKAGSLVEMRAFLLAASMERKWVASKEVNWVMMLVAVKG